MLYTNVFLTEKEEANLGIDPKFWEQEPIPISIETIEEDFEKNTEIYNVTFNGCSDDFKLNQKLYKNLLYVVLENEHRDIPNRKLSRHVLFIDEQDILNDLDFGLFFQKYGYWIYAAGSKIDCIPSFSNIETDMIFKYDSNKSYFAACFNYCKFVEKYEIEHKTKVKNAFQEESISLMYSKGYRIPLNLFTRLFSCNTIFRSEFIKNCISQNNIVGFGIVNLIQLKKERNEMDRYVDFCYRKMCKENIEKINTNA